MIQDKQQQQQPLRFAPERILGPAQFPSHSSSLLLNDDDHMMTPYRYYIVLHLRSTKLFSIEEIVQVGIIVVDAETFGVVFAFESLVKPSLLSDVSSTTRHTLGINYEDLVFDFSHVLEFLLRDLDWAMKEEGGALLVTLGNHQLHNLLRGQILIENALGKMDVFYAAPERLQLFNAYCNLEDVFYTTNACQLPAKPIRGFQDHLEYLYFYFRLDFKETNRMPPRAVDRALALLPIMKILSRRLGRPLYPTLRLPNLLPLAAPRPRSQRSPCAAAPPQCGSVVQGGGGVAAAHHGGGTQV